MILLMIIMRRNKKWQLNLKNDWQDLLKRRISKKTIIKENKKKNLFMSTNIIKILS